MRLSLRCLEVKGYRKYKKIEYAISHDPGGGLKKTISSNADKNYQTGNQWSSVRNWAGEQSSLSTAANPFFLSAGGTLKWTPLEF